MTGTITIIMTTITHAKSEDNIANGASQTCLRKYSTCFKPIGTNFITINHVSSNRVAFTNVWKDNYIITV